MRVRMRASRIVGKSFILLGCSAVSQCVSCYVPFQSVSQSVYSKQCGVVGCLLLLLKASVHKAAHQLTRKCTAAPEGRMELCPLHKVPHPPVVCMCVHDTITSSDPLVWRHRPRMCRNVGPPPPSTEPVSARMLLVDQMYRKVWCEPCCQALSYWPHYLFINIQYGSCKTHSYLMTIHTIC